MLKTITGSVPSSRQSRGTRSPPAVTVSNKSLDEMDSYLDRTLGVSKKKPTENSSLARSIRNVVVPPLQVNVQPKASFKVQKPGSRSANRSGTTTGKISTGQLFGLQVKPVSLRSVSPLERTKRPQRASAGSTALPPILKLAD